MVGDKHKRELGDSFWSDGGDGTGGNWLGKLLMELRDGLENYSPSFFLPQWIAYPDMHPYSIGWRMGYGEDYIMHLAEWRKTQSPEALKEYDNYFVPPEEWKDSES